MKLTIYIPTELLDYTNAEDTLVGVAGGCTTSIASGAWRDPDTGDIVRDPVSLVAVIFDEDERHEVAEAARIICAALIEAGEKSVLVETFGTRYRHQFITSQSDEVIVW